MIPQYWEKAKLNTETQRHREMDNALTFKIIGAAIEVHRILGGPGLLESIYEASLCHELTLQGLNVQQQLKVDVAYKGVIVKDPIYLDILVDKKVIVEVKATEKDHPIHEVQLLTYLRLTGIKLVLCIKSFGGYF